MRPVVIVALLGVAGFAAAAPAAASLPDPTSLPDCRHVDGAPVDGDAWRVRPQVRRVLAGWPFPLRVTYDPDREDAAEGDWYPADVRVTQLSVDDYGSVVEHLAPGEFPRLLRPRIAEPPASGVVRYTTPYGTWPLRLWVTRVNVPGWATGAARLPVSDADLAGRLMCLQTLATTLTATTTSPRLDGTFDVHVRLPGGGADRAVWRFRARCRVGPCRTELRSATGLRAVFRHRGSWLYSAAKVIPTATRNCFRSGEIVGGYRLFQRWRLEVTDPRFSGGLPGQPIRPYAYAFRAIVHNTWQPEPAARLAGCAALHERGPVITGTMRD